MAQAFYRWFLPGFCHWWSCSLRLILAMFGVESNLLRSHIQRATWPDWFRSRLLQLARLQTWKVAIITLVLDVVEWVNSKYIYVWIIILPEWSWLILLFVHLLLEMSRDLQGLAEYYCLVWIIPWWLCWIIVYHVLGLLLERWPNSIFRKHWWRIRHILMWLIYPRNCLYAFWTFQHPLEITIFSSGLVSCLTRFQQKSMGCRLFAYGR